MSVRTRLHLTLVTSSVGAPASGDGTFFRRTRRAIEEKVSRLLTGPLVRRGLHNQDVLIENQTLLARDAAAHARAAQLRAAYVDLERAESRHLELIFLAAEADLYVENRPWAVGFGAGDLILVNRGTKLVVGRASVELEARLRRHLPST